MKKLSTMLWFDQNGLEAAKFYVALFKGKLGAISYYAEGMPGPAGSVLVVEFSILGHRFAALNGGPMFKFNEAVSFVVPTKDQRETDFYWKKLIADGGAPSQCGWLKDKFGVSWQIVPQVMLDLMKSKDSAKSARVMQAIMGMTKLDIKTALKAAAEPKAAKAVKSAKK